MASIGKYTVLETLGSGAHSSILKVRRAEDGREYALKLVSLDGEETKKFLDQARHEWRVGQLLDHPNLLKLHCLEEEKDWLFRVKKARMLMEYVPGSTLDKAQLLNMAKLLRVLERVAAALTYMHGRGVVHADLKPNNLMLGKGTSVKVIDYGLARVLTDPPKDRIQGTPEYLAPETASHKIINEKTDIYNFGATMYRLATFKLPPAAFEAGIGPVERAAWEKKFKPVEEFNKLAPMEFCDLVKRCLSFGAMKRPDRMSEVQGCLDRLADEAEAKEGVEE